MTAVDVLKRLEWSAKYSYYTGWPACPICRGIKPGWGSDEHGIFPDNQGHRPNCALAEAIKETEYGCWCDLEPDEEPDACVLDNNPSRIVLRTKVSERRARQNGVSNTGDTEMNWEWLGSEDSSIKEASPGMCSRTLRLPSSYRRSLIAHNLAQAIDQEIAHAKRDGAMELAEAIRGQSTKSQVIHDDQLRPTTATPRMIAAAQKPARDAFRSTWISISAGNAHSTSACWRCARRTARPSGTLRGFRVS